MYKSYEQLCTPGYKNNNDLRTSYAFWSSHLVCAWVWISSRRSRRGCFCSTCSTGAAAGGCAAAGIIFKCPLGTTSAARLLIVERWNNVRDLLRFYRTGPGLMDREKMLCVWTHAEQQRVSKSLREFLCCTRLITIGFRYFCHSERNLLRPCCCVFFFRIFFSHIISEINTNHDSGFQQDDTIMQHDHPTSGFQQDDTIIPPLEHENTGPCLDESPHHRGHYT